MNGGHHKDLTEIAALWCGYTSEQAADLIAGAGGADYVDDVMVTIPGKGQVHDWRGRNFASLTHFEPGFCWNRDKSLGALEELGDLLMWASGCFVGGSSTPMRRVVEARKKTTLDDFPFPSASAMASHWSTFPALSEENGRALHMVQDSCCPHHGWGTLLWGHQEFEDEMEKVWNSQRAMGKQASDERAFGRMLRQLVDAEKVTGRTVEEVCRSNAAWAHEFFGQPHRIEQCPWDVALPVCARAIASSMQALEIMKGAA